MTRSVGQTIVLCGLSGARPRPLLRDSRQPGLNRVVLQVADRLLQFFRRPDPVVVRLILPERMPASPKDAVGNPAGPALKPAHDITHWGVRLEDSLHTIRHNRPGVEIVRTAGRAVLKSILNRPCDPRVAQPERTGSASIQPFIADKKWNPPGILCRQDVRFFERGGSGQAPRNEHNTVLWEPMRKMAFIQHDRPQKTMACPTGKLLTI